MGSGRSWEGAFAVLSQSEIWKWVMEGRRGWGALLGLPWVLEMRHCSAIPWGVNIWLIITAWLLWPGSSTASGWETGGLGFLPTSICVVQGG